MRTFRLWPLLLLFLAIPLRLSAQGAALPTGTKNAALRYWMAFSELKDEPLDKNTALLLERIEQGKAPWNEKALGHLLDSNLHAIQIMRRATKLPECDWGMEASSEEPVGLIYKARVLARLNTLEGMRLAARGDSEGAVSSWLDGIKFSQDVAKGGTLIFLLIGRSAMLSNLDAIKSAASSGELNADSRSAAKAVLNALPPTGFDWGAAWLLESAATENTWQVILKSKNPAAKYEELVGEELDRDFHLPNQAELQSYRSFMNDVAAELRRPPADARIPLKRLFDREKSLNPLFQNIIPNFEKANASREEVLAARQAALDALGSK